MYPTKYVNESDMEEQIQKRINILHEKIKYKNKNITTYQPFTEVLIPDAIIKKYRIKDEEENSYQINNFNEIGWIDPFLPPRPSKKDSIPKQDTTVFKLTK